MSADPWPQFAGEPVVVSCHDCGDDVILKGRPEAVAAAWANPDVRVLCVPCGLLRGVGSEVKP